MSDRTRTWTWNWQLKSSPEKLWPLVADTDRFNHFVGMPPVQFSVVPIEKRGVQREGRFRILGIPMVWDEYPFEFEAPKHFSVLRRYHGGLFHEIEASLRLTPNGTGTALEYKIRVQPRNFLGLLVAKLQVGVMTYAKFNSAFKRIDEVAGAVQPQFMESAGLGTGYRKRLSDALGALLHKEVLIEYLITMPDCELLDIRVFRLARERKISREEMLILFLRAAKVGVLEAVWQIVCPCCRGDKARSVNLRDLRFEQKCESCNIDFTADFTRLTELTFRLAPAWKQLERATYCVGSPMRTPHIVTQLRAPGASRTKFPVVLNAGSYRIRSAMSEGELSLVVAECGSNSATVVLTAQSLGATQINAQSALELEVENRLSHEATIAIERTAWNEDVCTADFVLAFQEFRDLFSTDVLATGVAVAVANVTVLFTDLKDSTALYTRTGDAKAFGLVSNHFEILERIVRLHHGAQIKNIGDAIMAAFTDASDAMRAALDMQQEIKKLRTSDGQTVVLKVGMHAGSCFAVTLNENLDYFGSTVNLAARIQGQSIGGDIVLEAALAENEEMKDLLGGLEREEFEVELKGIEGRRRLLRLRVR